jgi:ATP-binding protein involved in chromosome partitioning
MKVIQQLLFKVKWKPLDFLIIDMPPGTGDIQISISQLLVLSGAEALKFLSFSHEIIGAVLVSTGQKVALDDTLRGLNMLQKTKVPVQFCSTYTIY